MKHNPVTWFEIYVTDMKRARTFYQGLLDVELSLSDMSGEEMEMYLFPWEEGLPGAAGALIRHPMQNPAGEGHIIYFSVSDCGQTSQWALDQGSSVYVEKQSIGEHGFIAIVSDSDGNTIGLHSWS